MLVEHRIHDVDKGFVTREQAVAAGQQVAFEPPLTKVFAEHLHHATLPRKMDVVGLDLFHPDPLRRLEHIVEAIGCGLIGAHQTKIATLGIQAHDIAQIGSHHARCFGLRSRWSLDIHSVGAKVRKTELALE